MLMPFNQRLCRPFAWKENAQWWGAVRPFRDGMLERSYYRIWGFSGGSVVKNMPANAGDERDAGLIPALERSPGGGNSNPFQYSCLKIPTDRRTW